MTPDDPEVMEMARIHAAAFAETGRAWSPLELAELISDPHCFFSRTEAGFVLGRVTLDEVELLTLAVDPAAQSGGQGTGLMHAFMDISAARGASAAFLEVAEANTIARSLYRRFGFAEVGRRAKYYRLADGQTDDALVMHAEISITANIS